MYIFDKNINIPWVSNRLLIFLFVPSFIASFMKVSYFYFLSFGRGAEDQWLYFYGVLFLWLSIQNLTVTHT